MFRDYITTDLRRVLADRGKIEMRWRDWLAQYRAQITTDVKDFPWPGASNDTLPVTAMNTDPLIARFMTTLHAPSNLWTMQALSEKWLNAAKPLQDYLEFLDHAQLKMFDVNYRALLEFVKLGTCVYKVGWTFERRNTQEYTPSGKLEDAIKVISRPFVDHVSLVDFLIPAEALNIQPDEQRGAAWVAERIWLRRDQFLARATGQKPFMPDYDPAAVELVKNFIEQRFSGAQAATAFVGQNVEQERYILDNFIPSRLARIELFEVHARFGVSDDSDVNDLVAMVHLPSRTLLRVTANPYQHGQRPYEVARYFRGDGFYGMGVCEQSEVFQTGLSEFYNYQKDNVLVTNTPLIAIKQGANIVPGEPIYPLKMFVLDDPSTDMKTFTMAQANNSLPQLAGILQNWGERRTGINDINMGNPASLPSRTPATTTLSLLQEGNRRFDLSLKELRLGCLDRIGLRLLQLLQQYTANPLQNPTADAGLQMMVQALGDREGMYAAQALLLPAERIENGLGVSVTATSGTANKEVEKQSFLSLVQLQAQLAPQYLQLAQIFSNPQLQQMEPAVVETAKDLFKGFLEVHKRLLEQYDVRNPEDLLVNAAVLEAGVQAMGQGGPITAGSFQQQPGQGGQVPAGAQQGGGGGAGVPLPQLGLGGIPASAPAGL